MRRGEVYWVALDPTVGGEMQKTRPAIIVSNNSANRVLNRVIMVPLTTNTDRVLPGEALVEVRGSLQKAMASQMRAVSKLRIGKQHGDLSAADVAKVEQAILCQLGMRSEVAT